MSSSNVYSRRIVTLVTPTLTLNREGDCHQIVIAFHGRNSGFARTHSKAKIGETRWTSGLWSYQAHKKRTPPNAPAIKLLIDSSVWIDALSSKPTVKEKFQINLRDEVVDRMILLAATKSRCALWTLDAPANFLRLNQ